MIDYIHIYKGSDKLSEPLFSAISVKNALK